MDAYVMPRASMRAGLYAAQLDAYSAPVAATPFDAEAYTNQIMSADAGKASAAEDISDGVAAELKKQWASGETEAKRQVLKRILGIKLGLSPDSISEADSFAAHGGNSFVAMQIIGQLRSVLDVSVTVFSLMTESFGAFLRAALEATTSEAGSDAGDALTAGAPVVIRRRESMADLQLPVDLRPPSPSFVFFPMAGGSPRQFAGVYLALRKEVPDATFYFVQPAGRDARGDEPHAASIDAYCEPIISRLQANVRELSNGPCVFVGDSWGSIAALTVAHALQERCGFCPSHMIASGNESPQVVSGQMGLGGYSDRSVAEHTDDELVTFLIAAGAERGTIDAETVAALRADCMLHEAYTRPAAQRTVSSTHALLYRLRELRPRHVYRIGCAHRTHTRVHAHMSKISAEGTGDIAGSFATARTLEMDGNGPFLLPRVR